jgi:3'(2'), 5'-bisphosphate nucleotidase
VAAAELDDHALAARIATDAGQRLLELRAHLHGEGVDGKTLKDEGDRASHEFIMEALAAARPDDAVLSEEGKDDLARLEVARVWIVDPLDGTREFGEVPRDDWAVHVALVVDGTPIAGAVALPAQGVTLASQPAPVVPPAPDGPPRIVVSRTRPPAVATALAEALGAELVEMGSAGAKAASVVQGRSDIYPHSGGQYEWDSCAPVAVAAAAGLHVSRIDGSPLRYNNADPYLPDVLVCRPELADKTLATIAALES